jgi:hypothetical protein
VGGWVGPRSSNSSRRISSREWIIHWWKQQGRGVGTKHGKALVEL